MFHPGDGLIRVKLTETLKESYQKITDGGLLNVVKQQQTRSWNERASKSRKLNEDLKQYRVSDVAQRADQVLKDEAERKKLKEVQAVASSSGLNDAEEQEEYDGESDNDNTPSKKKKQVDAHSQLTAKQLAI